MPRADDDDYNDDRPRRPHDDDHDYDDRPRRRFPATNGIATASLIVGCVGVLLCILNWIAVVIGLTAVVLGFVGLSRAKETGVGRAKSIWGIVLGGLATLLGLAVIPLLLLSVQKVRESASRKQYSNNAMQLTIAMHSHNDVYNALPSLDSSKPQMNRGINLPPAERLSWRATVLPFLEEARLYQQIDFSKPWDAPGNKPATDTPVRVYSDPGDMTPDNQTRFRAFVGPGTLADPKLTGQVNLQSIGDGLSNTILFAESGSKVPWAQNSEMPYTPGMGGSNLGNPSREVFLVGMADGRVIWVKKSINPAILDAAITPNGGELPPALE